MQCGVEIRTEVITAAPAPHEQKEPCAFNTRVDAETFVTKPVQRLSRVILEKGPGGQLTLETLVFTDLSSFAMSTTIL